MISENLQLALQLLPLQLWNTMYMVIVSTCLAVLIGCPIGVVLTLTSQGHIKEHPIVYKTLETIVNIGRSFPFAILMVTLIPFTRWIVGTSLGTTASIIPLTVAAAPFVARLVETALKEIDRHTLEAVIVMGSSTWQIVTKVLLREALPSLISAVTTTMINLVGYSAMAGLIGGGGLGQVAIQYGYNRFNTIIMVLDVALLIALVQAIQLLSGYVSQTLLKKRGKVIYD
ncbi:MAG: ABC transporter permease [Chlamydiales bacterium]|jgi:D-methionine transport system permease protein|nr:ABC transporter permease [Chlamydiales bacterium]